MLASVVFREGPQTASASGHWIALLPFRSANPGEDPHIGLGITEALIGKLGNVHDVHVRPTNVIRKYLTASHDPVAAGRDLEVETILDGSLSRTDKGMHVTAQLRKASDGSVISVEEAVVQWDQRRPLSNIQDPLFEKEIVVEELLHDDHSRKTPQCLQMVVSTLDEPSQKKQLLVIGCWFPGTSTISRHYVQVAASVAHISTGFARADYCRTQ